MPEMLQNTTISSGASSLENVSLFNNNATTEARLLYTPLDYINMVLLPICLLTGIFGNSMTIILMETKTFSKMASKFFLVALAISDMSVLFTQPFKNMYVIRYIGHDIRALSTIGCKFYFWLHKTGKMTSSWFIVLLSLERLAAVRFPFKVKQWFCKRNTLITIFILYVVIGGFNIGYSYCTEIDDNGICNPDVYDKTDPASVSLYKTIVNVGVSLYFIGPLVILFIVTPLIIFNLIQASRNRAKLTNSHGRKTDIAKPTTMLLTVIVAYILFVTPIGIIRIISSSNGINLFGLNTTLFLVFRDISHILELINYAINFFVFVCTSKQFRDGVRLLFCSGKCSSSPSSTRTTITRT